MIRSALASAVLGVAALAAPAAQAHSPVVVVSAPPVLAPVYGPAIAYYPVPVTPVYRRYEVLYRRCAGEPWHVHGVFPVHGLAHEAAHRLRHLGFEVRVAVGA